MQSSKMRQSLLTGLYNVHGTAQKEKGMEREEEKKLKDQFLKLDRHSYNDHLQWKWFRGRKILTELVF